MENLKSIISDDDGELQTAINGPDATTPDTRSKLEVLNVIEMMILHNTLQNVAPTNMSPKWRLNQKYRFSSHFDGALLNTPGCLHTTTPTLMVVLDKEITRHGFGAWQTKVSSTDGAASDARRTEHVGEQPWWRILETWNPLLRSSYA